MNAWQWLAAAALSQVEPHGPDLATERQAALAESDEGLRAARLERVAARSAAIETVRTRLDGTEAPLAGIGVERTRKVLAGVLARREFAAARGAAAGRRGAGELWAEWMDSLRRWIEEHGRDEARADASGPWFRGSHVLWAAAVLGIVTLVLLVLSRSGQGEQRRGVEGSRSGGEGDAAAALERAPEQWQALVEERLRRGDRTGALRAVYLGVLVGLHRRGAIELRPSSTNGEHLRRVARSLSAAQSEFAELTRMFNRAVYGGLAPAGPQLQRAVALARRIELCGAAGQEPAR